MLKEFIEKTVREQPRTFAFTLSKIRQEWFVNAVIAETSYLPHSVTFSQRIWHLINGKDVPKCEVCNKEIEIFRSYSRGYEKHCSRTCRQKARWKNIPQHEREATKRKREQTNLEKFGNIHSFASGQVKENIKKSMIKNWGVENPSQSKELKAKADASRLKTHGVVNPGQPQNAKKSRIRALGVENPFSSRRIQEQIKETNLERDGVEHPFQEVSIFEKAIKFRTKTYIASNGKKYLLQGFENVALEILLKELSEEDIVCSRSEMSKIFKCFYEFNGKRRYYPDFYVPSENLVIEVKSKFSLNREFEKNRAKMKAIKEMGMKMEIWVCSKDELLEKLSEI